MPLKWYYVQIVPFVMLFQATEKQGQIFNKVYLVILAHSMSFNSKLYCCGLQLQQNMERHWKESLNKTY